MNKVVNISFIVFILSTLCLLSSLLFEKLKPVSSNINIAPVGIVSFILFFVSAIVFNYANIKEQNRITQMEDEINLIGNN